MSEQDKEMKDIIKTVVESLSKRGITVEGASILKIKDDEKAELKTKPMPFPESVEFNNFEQVFGVDKEGIFDTATVILGKNKKFNIKYYSGPMFGESILIMESNKLQTLTLDELRNELDKSIQKKDYERTQQILDLIRGI